MSARHHGARSTTHFSPTGKRCRICGMIAMPTRDFPMDESLCISCWTKVHGNRKRREIAARLTPAERRKRAIVDFDDDDAMRRLNEKHPLILGEDTMATYAAMLDTSGNELPMGEAWE